MDDDDPFRGRLGRAMTSKGFEVTLAKGVEEAKLMAKKNPPAFAVIDLRLLDGNGLDVVDEIHRIKRRQPNSYAYRIWKFTNSSCSC